MIGVLGSNITEVILLKMFPSNKNVIEIIFSN